MTSPQPLAPGGLCASREPAAGGPSAERRVDRAPRTSARTARTRSTGVARPRTRWTALGGRACAARSAGHRGTTAWVHVSSTSARGAATVRAVRGVKTSLDTSGRWSWSGTQHLSGRPVRVRVAIVEALQFAPMGAPWRGSAGSARWPPPIGTPPAGAARALEDGFRDGLQTVGHARGSGIGCPWCRLWRAGSRTGGVVGGVEEGAQSPPTLLYQAGVGVERHAD